MTADDRAHLRALADPDQPGASTLRELLTALDTAVVELVHAPSGDDVVITSVALAESADLAAAGEPATSVPHLCLHVGVTNAEAVRWLDDVARRAPEHRPRAVMSKAALRSSALRTAARRAGVALVAVHPKARWDHVLPLVQRMLDRSRQQASSPDSSLLAMDTDLFGLAQIVASNARGMVSIEDAHSRVLAYSPSDESADELRTLSILGREGPRDYLRALHTWGVYDRLRDSDEVVDVPAHAELGTKRRLVVSIRRPSEDGSAAPAMLGTIWLQQGDRPFAPDAADVLRGASAIAARVISRGLNAPSTEGLLIQRLFGVRGEGVDVPSLAGALNLPLTGPAAVIGFATSATEGRHGTVADLGSTLRLHASSFRRDSVATLVGDRAYVLLPGYTSESAVAAWTRQLVEQFERRRSQLLRAAIAMPVAGLAQVAGARAEVDRVLDGTAATFPEGRVTTLAESRTAVLLGEILDLVRRHPDLHDPRLHTLLDHDALHDTTLRETVETYLTRHGDVRGVAEELRVHPNTVRYRVRRAEEILGMDLSDAADRLLLQLQLSLLRRGENTPRT
ncbi:PucR family transcriptional regulator [Saccharomonospora xinjiangensis]|uniref:PucR family transcriptional regulator n=1 Tax=Saccharomonospora xinjiangensis TaxID=75294 RepID=UPI00350F6F42